MELRNLNTEKQCIKDLFPNPQGGEGLTVWFSPEAITPAGRRRIMAMKAEDDEADAIMTILEVMALEWNLKSGGVAVIPSKDIPSDIRAECEANGKPLPPTFMDVPLKALLAIAQAIQEHTNPKASTEA